MPKTAMDTAVLHIRIPTEVDDWLRAEAKRRMVSVTFLVTSALEQLRGSIPGADGDA